MSGELRRLLETMDVKRARQFWARAAPHLPQPANDAEAEAIMHHARTAACSMTLRQRAWSHRWLCERGLPSGLPDELRPVAERLYPRIVSTVGIAVAARSPSRRPHARALMQAIGDAVLDCYANGDTDPAIVAAQMRAARQHFDRSS